jgi:hypothetical protein
MAVGQDAEDDGALGAEDYADRSASEYGDSDEERGPISGDDESDGEEVDGLAKKVEGMEVNEELFNEEDVAGLDDDDDDDDDE